MDTPPPLAPHVVSLSLSYLSRLDNPLPPHLLSTPLRQRHHFLGLGSVLDTADDVAAYLSWPSTSGSERDALHLVDLLDSLPSPENFDPLGAYPTKYSYDGETVYAHVKVPTDRLGGNDSVSAAGLRLVFRWEAKDGEGAVQDHKGVATTNADNWKYHDAKPMPYPPNSYDTPQTALQPHAEESTPTQSHPPPSAQLPTRFDSYLEPEHGSDSDEDAYWNAYGRTNSDDEDEGAFSYSRAAASSNLDDDEKAEEAYWAQYASIHGTADSTRHSPLPPKRRLHDPSQPVRPTLDYSYLDKYDSQEDFLAPDIRQPDGSDHLFDNDPPHIDYVTHLTTFRGRETSPDGIPCPEALSRRLHNLSPRISTTPSPAPPETVDALGLENAESPDAVSSDTSETQILTPPSDAQSSALLPQVFPTLVAAAEKGRNVDEDVGVHEAVRGIYKLWLTTQKSKSENVDASVEKDRFLEVVRDALKLA